MACHRARVGWAAARVWESAFELPPVACAERQYAEQRPRAHLPRLPRRAEEASRSKGGAGPQHGDGLEPPLRTARHLQLRAALEDDAEAVRDILGA